jgi:hypothetical protein
MKRGGARGYTVLELIFVMALLLVFGITTVSLAIAGGNAYQAIVKDKDANAELRVAASYVGMKLRQNDLSGAIRLAASPSGNGEAIVIEEKASDAVYETWIWQSGGELLEGYVKRGEPVDRDVSFRIAAVDGFTASMETDGRTLVFAVWLENGGKRMERDGLIHLRSE